MNEYTNRNLKLTEFVVRAAVEALTDYGDWLKQDADNPQNSEDDRMACKKSAELVERVRHDLVIIGEWFD